MEHYTGIVFDNKSFFQGFTNGKYWDWMDEWRKDAKRKGEIDRNLDRHLRAIKAYWLNLPQKLKRSGTKSLKVAEAIKKFINSEWIQKESLFDGIVETEAPAGYKPRKAYKTLDELFEDYSNSGLIEIIGTDEKGRIIWVATDYMVIVFDKSRGGFVPYVQEKN